MRNELEKILISTADIIDMAAELYLSDGNLRGYVVLKSASTALHSAISEIGQIENE